MELIGTYEVKNPNYTFELYHSGESFIPYVQFYQLHTFLRLLDEKNEAPNLIEGESTPIEPTLKELIDKLAAQTGCDKKKLVDFILNQQKEKLEQSLKALEKDLAT